MLSLENVPPPLSSKVAATEMLISCDSSSCAHHLPLYSFSRAWWCVERHAQLPDIFQICFRKQVKFFHFTKVPHTEKSGIKSESYWEFSGSHPNENCFPNSCGDVRLSLHVNCLKKNIFYCQEVKFGHESLHSLISKTTVACSSLFNYLPLFCVLLEHWLVCDNEFLGY